MSFAKKLIKGLISPLGAVAGLFGGGGGAKPIQAQPAALTESRNDALERAAAADALARRTGARGRRRTPRGGAEALTGAKTSLLGRSG